MIGEEWLLLFQDAVCIIFPFTGLFHVCQFNKVCGKNSVQKMICVCIRG